MKKIYMTLFAGLLFSQVTNAQTLTLAANQPSVGDVNNYKGYDSVGVVPKNMGTGQTWNFSAFTQNTLTASSSFSTSAAVPTASAPVGTTEVEVQGGGNYTFWKSSSTPTLESLGYKDALLGTFTFTNSAVVAVWPVSISSTVTDAFSGTLAGSLAGTCDGTINAMGAGTGTITLPGGFITLSNVLQTKVVQTLTVNANPVTGTIIATDYAYYHASQKFPVLTVSYKKTTLVLFTPTVTTSASIKGNALILTGVNDINFDATFAIFPNPAKESFNVSLSNTNNENSSIVIYNSVGQVVKTIELGTASVLEKNIVISDLSSGIYIVKTSLGNKSSARRLIVE